MGSVEALRLDRRVFLAGSAAAAASLLLTRPASAAQRLSDVRPRDAWGASLPPTGPLEEERPEDVRFLLLHHSASGNDYGPDAVPGILRSFYHYHTGPEKGWPDIAYNFLVDRYGTVWEGRAGSLSGPVKGSATGGSQGFALLCCFIGNHASQRPTDAAIDAMAGVCAALAHRYGIDASPGATTSFVSRGSNKHPSGKEVSTATVAGHRDMSQTSCPGDAGYRLVRDEMPERIARARALLEEAGGSGDGGGSGESDAGESGGGDEDSSGPERDGGSDDSDEAPDAEPEPTVPDRREDVRAPEVAAPDPGDPPQAGGGAPPGQQERTSLLDRYRRATTDYADAAPASATDATDDGSVLDSLGLRELTILGVAAAATLGGATVAKRGRSHRGTDGVSGPETQSNERTTRPDA